jgi:predicted TIM-barrel fold metal-dependent hydrolase
MVSLSDTFVIDGVSHSYNLAPSNYRVPEQAEPVARNGYGLETSMPDGYVRTQDSFISDWDIADTESVLFQESDTDFTAFHPQTIMVFDDGLTAYEKAKQFQERNPNRGVALAGIDPIGMDDPKAELTRQVEELDAHGVKVYPSYWEEDGTHHGFRMDDPETAFPLWQHAVDLGLDVVAVHKAFPFGAVPMKPYKVDDIEEAAMSFPELNFEIVHGGLTFGEETGWQIMRHPNVYINLELTLSEAVTTPKTFVDTMQEVLYAGGKQALDKVIWATGAPHFHPQLLLEQFWEFDFPEMDGFAGEFTITQEDKQKILADNFAEAHGFDLDELKSRVADAESEDEVADPWSTTEFEVIGA